MLLADFPLADMPASVPTPAETVAIMEHLSTIPLTAAKIKQQTGRDPTLSKVKHYTQAGWLETLDAQDTDLKPFHNRRKELSLEDNVILWGNRVVIPSCFQPRVIEVLHFTHIDFQSLYEEVFSLSTARLFRRQLESHLQNS